VDVLGGVGPGNAFADGGFEFANDQRNAVDEHDQVEPLAALGVGSGEIPLVGDDAVIQLPLVGFLRKEAHRDMFAVLAEALEYSVGGAFTFSIFLPKKSQRKIQFPIDTGMGFVV